MAGELVDVEVIFRYRTTDDKFKETRIQLKNPKLLLGEGPNGQSTLQEGILTLLFDRAYPRTI